MHLLLYSKKVVLFFCGAKQNKRFSPLCDLTIDFCFFHHHRACFFCFFGLLLFLFHRTLVFFVSSPQKKSPLRDFKRNSLCSSLLRYTHTQIYRESESESQRERQTTRKLLVLLALLLIKEWVATRS